MRCTREVRRHLEQPLKSLLALTVLQIGSVKYTIVYSQPAVCVVCRRSMRQIMCHLSQRVNPSIKFVHTVFYYYYINHYTLVKRVLV